MLKTLFLPDLFLPTRIDLHCHTTGIDSLEQCLNREHYLSYPQPVEYHYNSRGFRDAEWPENLVDVIWCIGDSFTVGLGSPREHIWPYVLQQRTGQRTINVSLDGASNNWIARMAVAILTQFPQAKIAVQWSFLHRREADLALLLELKFQNFYNTVKDSSWPECNSLKEFEKLPKHIKTEILDIHKWPGRVYGDESRVHETAATIDEDIANTQKCIAQLPAHVVHTAIPTWAPPGVKLDFNNVMLVTQLDCARDAFHYDILTSCAVVDKIIPALAQYATS
jgi:hypothetical protein